MGQQNSCKTLIGVHEMHFCNYYVYIHCTLQVGCGGYVLSVDTTTVLGVFMFC